MSKGIYKCAGGGLLLAMTVPGYGSYQAARRAKSTNA